MESVETPCLQKEKEGTKASELQSKCGSGRENARAERKLSQGLQI